MTDKELLELAAEAIGFLGGEYCEPNHEPAMHIPGVGFWMPLTDSGDALELAAQLDIHITPRNTIYAGLTSGGIGHTCLAAEHVDSEQSKPTAWRRAIVRVAAHIGRDMKGKNHGN